MDKILIIKWKIIQKVASQPSCMETLIEASVLDPNCRMSTNLVSKGDIAPIHKPLSNACQFSFGHSPKVKDVFLHKKETKKHQHLNKNIVLPTIDTCTCQLHEEAWHKWTTSPSAYYYYLSIKASNIVKYTNPTQISN